MADSKVVTITRKIEIYLDGYENDDYKEAINTLYKWREICFKGANIVSTHCFAQEKIKDFFYLTDETKVKLANVSKDEDGILNTSKQNTTYQVLSSLFKGKIPTSILTSLNSTIVSSFNEYKKEIFSGERSISSFKKTIPIPFQATSIRNLTKIDDKDKNYSFNLFDFRFKTRLGADLSGNEEMIERHLRGEYKLCDSSIKIDKQGKKTKIFLLAVFQFDKMIADVDKSKNAIVKLDFNTPLIVEIDGKVFNIGDKEEFLHRRLAIQAGLKRAQIASKFNKGGKGIQKKISAINKFKKAEKSYVESRIHKYSANLINLCLKHRVGNIFLTNMEDVKEKTNEEEFLLRNWSYFGLNEKIKYKANKYSLDVIEN